MVRLQGSQASLLGQFDVFINKITSYIFKQWRGCRRIEEEEWAWEQQRKWLNGLET